MSGGAPLLLAYCYDGFNLSCNGSDASADAGSMTAALDVNFGWTYDYDALGRLLSEKRNGAVVREYAYAANGNVLWERQPNGLYIKFQYAVDGRLLIVRYGADSTPDTGSIVLSGFSWRSTGDLKSVSFAGSTLSNWLGLSWDHFTSGPNYQSGRVESVVLKTVSSGAVQEQIDYSYAYDGTVSQMRRKGQYELNGIPPWGQIRHDSLGRVTRDLDSGVSWGTQTFSYDDAGNRTTRDPQAAGELTYSFSSSGSNKITAAEGKAYAFDNGGNVISRTPGVTTLGYDELGRVTSVAAGSGTTTFARDYRNLRVSKAGAGGVAQYFYGSDGNMIQWTGPQVVVTTGCAVIRGIPYYRKYIPYENYIHAGGHRLAMIKGHIETNCSISSGGGTTWGGLIVDGAYVYFNDKMGMPRAIYSKAGAAKVWTANFDSFANPIAGGVNENPAGAGVFTNSFRLPGQFALSAAEGGPSTTAGGLHENWNRVYDSVIGRYLEVDPLVAVAGLMRPRPQNGPFTYAENASLALTDQTGLDPQVCCEYIAGTQWRVPFSIVGVGTGSFPISRGKYLCRMYGESGDAWDLAVWNQQLSGEMADDLYWGTPFVSPRHVPRAPPPNGCHACKKKCEDVDKCLDSTGVGTGYYDGVNFTVAQNSYASAQYGKCCEKDGWSPKSEGMPAPGWGEDPFSAGRNFR